MILDGHARTKRSPRFECVWARMRREIAANEERLILAHGEIAGMKPVFIGMCIRLEMDAVCSIRWIRSAISTMNTSTWSAWSIGLIRWVSHECIRSEFACTHASPLFLKSVCISPWQEKKEGRRKREKKERERESHTKNDFAEVSIKI